MIAGTRGETLDWTQRLNAALDYLEATLDREPDLEHAALLANCSLFHFLRMFEVVSGMTAGDYSRRRRLSRAAIDLAAGGEKVIEVALRYGYESPEAFAKAFKRLFGITPSEARSPEATLQTWPPLRLAVVLQGENAMRFRIVEKPAFTVGGWALRTSCLMSENLRTIPQFWNECLADGRVRNLLAHMDKMGHIGLCCEWDRAKEELTYMIGVDLPDAGAGLPVGTREVTVPAATYAVFESIGPMPHTIQHVWIRAFNEWFPTSGWEHAGTPDFEVYPAFADDDPRGDITSEQCYCEVWIPLKKQSILGAE
jgi:AraC family transcriptional regulator